MDLYNSGVFWAFLNRLNNVFKMLLLFAEWSMRLRNHIQRCRHF